VALTMTVHLVRHGQSEWNVARLVQGQTRHPRLTALGHRQAAASAAALARLASLAPIDLVMSSDLIRAAQTADPIAAALGLNARPEPRLRERAMGHLEGMTSDAAFELLAGAAWADDVPLGGQLGESHSDVVRRVGALLAELMQDPTAHAAVLVTHGDAIRAAISWLAATAPAADLGEEVPAIANASITSVRLVDGVLAGLDYLEPGAR
jgi:broad specificity phosphatase PhoE